MDTQQVRLGMTREDSFDHELQRRVLNYLVLRGLGESCSLRLAVCGGNVLLWGEVPSASAKWRCAECCRHVAGVLNVIDRLVVNASRSGFPA